MQADNEPIARNSAGEPARDFLPENGNTANPLDTEVNLPDTSLRFITVQSELLWQQVGNHKWRAVARQIDTLQRTRFVGLETRTILATPNPENGDSLVATLLRNSAPPALVKQAVLAGAPLQNPSSQKLAGVLPTFDISETSQALQDGKFQQAHALLMAGAPTEFVDSDGNTILHQIEKHLFNSNGSYVDLLAPALCQSIIQNNPALINYRNRNGELAITRFAMAQCWSAVEELAVEHKRNKGYAVTLEEALALRLWALANDAPLRTLQAITPLLELSEARGSMAGIPDRMRKSLLLPFLQNPSAPDWYKFKSLIYFLEKNRSEIPKHFLESVLNARKADSRLAFAQSKSLAPTVLHYAYLLEAGPPMIERLMDLGADPAARFNYQNTQMNREFPKCTLLHVIVFNEDSAQWKVFPRKSDLLLIPNGEGNPPLHMYAEEHQRRRKDDLPLVVNWVERVLQEHHGEVYTDSGKNISDVLLESGGFDWLEVLHHQLAPPTVVEIDREYSTLVKNETLHGEWLFRLIVDRLAGASDSVQAEARDLLVRHHDLHDLYLYAEAYQQMTGPEQLQGEAFLQLLPILFEHYPAKQVEYLLGEVESYHDERQDTGQTPIQHVNEGEFYLYLNHPGFRSFDPSEINFLTSLITSVARFINQEPPVPLQNIQAIRNWGRAGLLTHSHIRYKFDSRSTIAADGEELPPLLTEFGFGTIQTRWTDLGDPRDSIPALGNGFLLVGRALDGLPRQYRAGAEEQTSAFSTSTVIELRRGYYLVAHPEAGTLVIRNSSLVFGRDSLEHPAYWSPTGVGESLTLSELINLTVDKIELGMRHLVHVDIHQPDVTIHSNQNIAFLLDQFKIFQAEYRAWKFDTNAETAFVEQDGVRRLSKTGAWNSPGLKEIVRRLNCSLGGTPSTPPDEHTLQQRSPLALAFAHPHMPVWSTHRFIDENGISQDKLLLTARRLQVLNQLVDRKASRDDLIDTGLQSFFQVAGINTHGELIVTEPKKSDRKK